MTVGDDLVNDGTYNGNTGTIGVSGDLDNNGGFVQGDGNITVTLTFDNANGGNLKTATSSSNAAESIVSRLKELERELISQISAFDALKKQNADGQAPPIYGSPSLAEIRQNVEGLCFSIECAADNLLAFFNKGEMDRVGIILVERVVVLATNAIETIGTAGHEELRREDILANNASKCVHRR